MAKRKQQVSSDNNVSGSHKRSSTSGGETDYFDPIPFDLVMNIFSRLSCKSLAKCRCVSKRWSSIIRRPNYNQLFSIKSSAPPRLLFAFNVGSNLFFYSSPKPQDLDVDSSVVATRHYTNLGTGFYKLCRPLRGLVCSQHKGEKKYSWAVISNPITGEYVTTPKVSIEGVSGWIKGKAEYYFGYDPIEKQFKVLRLTWLSCKPDNLYARYHVLTLETGNRKNLSWRRIQSCTFHYPLDDDSDNGICINGVFYYPAMSQQKTYMVCFDVRSEKFSFTNIGKGMGRYISRPFILINYKGKLGVTEGYGIYHPYSELWVLEDAEKHKWSKHVFINLQWPHHLQNEKSHARLAGMISSEEIVLSPIHTRDPFFIYYYNLEREIFTRVRVEVPVVDESKYCRVYTFPNFVEDVKLI